jgi:hypothetical protein
MVNSMLRFFRTIRKKLIDEDNVRKYLLYSIGEILLVVIGILIALQVNNWNEERKNRAQAEKHLETIRLNLVDDIAQAENLLLETETAIEYADIFFEQFKTLRALDNNVQMYLIYLMFEREMEVNKSGMNTLLSTNGLSSVNEQLQSKLLEYYRHTEQLKRREENANTEIKTMYEPYAQANYHWIYNKTNPWHRQIEYYKDDPRPFQDIDQKLESIINDKQMEMMVVRRIYQIRLLADFYSKTIELAEDIISHIENK